MTERRARILRNCSFAFVFVAALFSFSTNAKAFSGNTIRGLMDVFDMYYDCSVAGSDWSASIHCDFPDEEWPNDELTYCAYLGDELWHYCGLTCVDDYGDVVAVNLNKDRSCIDSWLSGFNAYCAEDDAYVDCSCSYYNYCPDR